MTSLLVFLAVLAVQVTAVFAAIHAMRRSRTPQGAVGWVVFLLSAPYVALVVYTLVGQWRFTGYVSQRRMSDQVSDKLKAYGQRNRARLKGDSAAGRVASAFERITDLPPVSGGDAELLIDGEVTFGAILEAIRGANSYVLLQSYILRDDVLGGEVKRALIAKAREGCVVRVLYDAIGCHALPTRYFEELDDAGVEIQDFHAIRRSRTRLQINFRNHRKLVVVDGETGFVGGLNVGDEYVGRNARFGPWRDTHLKLRGPVVAQLQLIFVEDWYWATEERLNLNWDPERAAADYDAMVVATGPADRLETGSLYFCNAIHAAQERIWIASPYFVIDADIIRALQLAVLRGVDVTILVPDKRDHWLVWLAGFSFLGDVASAGVRVLRYCDGFMHQKVVLVDDLFASVGSMNLDNRSCRLNFEVTAVVFDERFVAQVEAMFERDFARSRPHAERVAEMPRFVLDYVSPFAGLFSPLL